jgi:hypothetical protein
MIWPRNVDPPERRRVINVQALGMDTGTDLTSAHVESLLNRADRDSPTVRSDVLDGIRAWRIDYSRKAPDRAATSHFSLWLAPDQGYSVIGITIRTLQGGKHYECIIRSALKQYPANNVWYPAQVTKTLMEGGKAFDREVITVEDAQFGVPVEDKAFTLAGLGLQLGREIVDSSSGQSWGKVWNGRQAVDPSRVPPPVLTEPDRRWVWWTLAAVLGLLAVIYFWRVFVYRRTGLGH